MARRLLVTALLVCAPVWAADPETSPQAPAGPLSPRPPLVESFRLFPDLVSPASSSPIVPPPKPVDLSGVGESKRLFHQAGDPDSLFTFGKPTPQGELRLKAALEVNEVILKALTPDLRVESTDTRPRTAGDYRALDAGGRPYQLRLGARLVW